MRIWMVSLLTIAGCGFEAVARPGAEGGSAGPEIDCKVPTGLKDQVKLCVTFAPEPMIQDVSGLGHVLRENTAVRVAPTTRDADPAASLASGAWIQVDDAADLDLALVTMDMWIKPAGKAPSLGYRLLEKFGQYSAWYLGSGAVRCGVGAGRNFDSVDSSTAFADPTTWHHVACVVSANRLRVYVDGSLTGCSGLRGRVPTGVHGATAIGAFQPPGPFTARYEGGLDEVHVFGRDLSDAEVCSLAGKTACAPTVTCSGGQGDE